MSGSKSVPFGSRFKRSGGVCLSPTYTGNWLFRELHHLVILSDSIKPWPMTLAPTNEAIRCEILQKKTLWVKKTTMIWEYHGYVYGYYLSILRKIGESRTNLLTVLISSSTKGVILWILSLSDFILR